MAQRKIKISPRGQQRPQDQETKKTSPPKPDPKPVSEGTSSPNGRVWPVVLVLVLIGAVLVWLFVPFGSGELPSEEDLTTGQEEGLDLSEFDKRAEFYASAGYDLYDVIELSRVPRSNIQGILNAYREERDRTHLSESVYRVFTHTDNPRRDALLVIEPDPPLYQLAITLVDPIGARTYERDIERIVRSTSVVLPHPSLGNALWDAQVPREMLEKIEEAFAWTVDLHHLEAGDEIEMIYEEYVADGQNMGIGQVFCFRFDTHQGTYYAFHYQEGAESVYLDENALSMKKRFLKAPVKYSTITSHYGARYHPVKKEMHVHRGTDYAAPRGTPILALGDGTIIAKSFTSGNGNFVKIRHDETYDTQYLHLDSFAETIEPGSRVKQGDVIGYVGSTGLATGPHVCLRLWKAGQQVNFIEEEAMDAKPLRASALNDFLTYRDSLMNVLKLN